MTMFFNRGSHPSLKQGSFRLTEEGRAKLQACFDSTPGGRILVALETSGSSLDLREISQASGVSVGQAERLLAPLIRKGYVTPLGTGTGGDM